MHQEPGASIKNANNALGETRIVDPVRLSITIEKRDLIDRLLKQAKYHVFVELRDHIRETLTDVIFYNLFQQDDGVIKFLEAHPVIGPLLLSEVKARAGDFFTELSSIELMWQFRAQRQDHYKAKALSRDTSTIIKPDGADSCLVEIEEAPLESEKMKKLTESNTLNMIVSFNLERSVAVFHSLSLSNLFIILKQNDAQGKSMFSLCQEKGVICELIARYQGEPRLFCEVIEYFKPSDSTIQSLVNIVGLKKTIRRYLLNLPDSQEKGCLLDRCLEPTEAMGRFCSTEAKRFGSFFTSDDERKTITKIREKVRLHRSLIAWSSPIDREDIVPLVIGEPILPDRIEQLEPSLNSTSEEEDSLSELSASSSDDSTSLYTPPVEKPNSDFWLYTTCAIVVLASCLACIYNYLGKTEEDQPQFRFN